MSDLSLRRMLLTMRSRYHLWSGRRAYRLGRMRRAGQHFREALASGADSYEAWLLLGKIYYRQNNLGRAAEAFDQARSADPSRYLLEGFPDDFIGTLAEHGRAASRPDFRIRIEAARRGAARVEVEQPQMPFGDFANRDEWRAHQDRPPLRPEEAQTVDWDAAARELFDD